MGFNYAGNLGGAGAPLVRRFFTSETCYVGQLVMPGGTAGTGGHIQIADVPTLAKEDVLNPFGFISGIVDDSRTYVAASSGTANYGDRTTYTTTQATVKANGPSEVEVTLIVPGVTLVRAPLYNAAWGTALPVMTEDTGSAGGTVVTDTTTSPADIADDYGIIYCRSGANRGISRIVTTNDGSGACTVTVPFPNAIAIGDTFVTAACVEGYGRLDFPASADCIDGNNTLAAYLEVYYHDINLEESGKEYAIFTLLNWGHGHGTYDAIST